MVGIAEQLRQAVLQAAIQGKLTKQLPEDGDARDLLAEIQAEKAKLITEKRTKKENPLETIAKDEVPFDVSNSWSWAKLGDLCLKIGAGNTPPGGKNSDVYKTDGIKFIRSMNVYNDGLHYEGMVYISEELASKRAGNAVIAKDMLLNITGGSIGRCAIVPNDFDIGNVNQHVLIIRCVNEQCRSYIHLVICSPLIQAAINEKAVGDKAGFSANKAKNLLIPLPPLAEQHRIVARVDELMAKIDELEKVENELNALHKAFPRDMKAALLQAAMQGKLTEQLPEDGNAEDLLKSIEAEKGKLVAEKKIKKQKALEPIADDEIPFEIPDNWKWNRLRNLVYNRGQKTPVKEFSYIDIGSIDNIHQRLNDNETIIPAAEAPSRARKIVGLGDILYSTVRPYLHNACIIDKNFRAEPIASTGFAVLTCYKGVNSKYLLYYMLSPAFDQYANATDNAKGVAYPAINDEKLYKAVVPLPPLAEQQRIVEKLDKLLPLCDSLEERL